MQTDKYTIAWFKIAECVSRGEKERALGVYRLLSHSFNDDAVARQLEADIYLLCGEQERAIELYRQATELYEKSNRFLESAAIYEHLMMLLPKDIQVRNKLLHLYMILAIVSKVIVHMQAIKEDKMPISHNEIIEKVIATFLHYRYDKQLKDFLSALRTINQAWYGHACTVIETE
jgi:tetratricopeptide (TPR) repeat protein